MLSARRASEVADVFLANLPRGFRSLQTALTFSSETKVPRARAHAHTHGLKAVEYQTDLQIVFVM